MLIEGPGHDNLHEVNKRKEVETSLLMCLYDIRTMLTVQSFSCLFCRLYRVHLLPLGSSDKRLMRL